MLAVETVEGRASAKSLTEGTVVLVNPARYQALLDAGLLAEVEPGVYGIPDQSDPFGEMIFCQFAAFEGV